MRAIEQREKRVRPDHQHDQIREEENSDAGCMLHSASRRCANSMLLLSLGSGWHDKILRPNDQWVEDLQRVYDSLKAARFGSPEKQPESPRKHLLSDSVRHIR